MQVFPYFTGGVTQNVTLAKWSTNQDGSVACLCLNNASGTSCFIQRYLREPGTGNYVQTHAVTLTPSSGADNAYPVFAGAYIYITYSDGGTKKIKRYAVADLTGAQDITISGTNWTTG